MPPVGAGIRTGAGAGEDPGGGADLVRREESPLNGFQIRERLFWGAGAQAGEGGAFGMERALGA